MKILYSLKDFPSLQRARITIGVFDGFHKGHQKIFSSLFSALQKDELSVLITFVRNPKYYLLKDQGYSRSILNLKERVCFLKKNFRFDYVVFLLFSNDLFSMSHESFFALLKQKVVYLDLYVGNNFFFGKDRQGNVSFLYSKESSFFSLNVINYFKYKNLRVSSTLIRELIKKKEMEDLHSYLGYSFFISSICVQGKKIGRKIGYPTINMDLGLTKVMPPLGVYYTQVEVEGVMYDGMSFLNFYKNNVFIKQKQFILETNIFNFSKNVYGKFIKVFFKKWIRPAKNFCKLEDLKRQLGQDKKIIKEIINKLT